MKFTPGPWDVYAHEPERVYWRNELICECGYEGADLSTTHSNAKLIAAAPEMFAFIQEFCLLGAGRKFATDLENARKLIAKILVE